MAGENLPKDLADYLGQLFKKAATFRGQYLEQAVAIEELVIDLVLRGLSTDEANRRLIRSVILDQAKVTFSEVSAMLRKLTELKPLVGIDEALLDDIGKVRRFRNNLAHSHVDSSDGFTRHRHLDRIQFAYIEDGITKNLVVTDADARQRLVHASSALQRLAALQQQVSGSD